VTDLAAVASRLSRAADKAEQLAAAASGHGEDGYPPRRWAAEGGSVAWDRPTGFPDGDDVVWVANNCTGSEAEFIATFDPRTVAALIPLLRQAAQIANDGYHCDSAFPCGDPDCGLTHGLAAFAALLLGEEETGG
jgi:hypothetical protein